MYFLDMRRLAFGLFRMLFDLVGESLSDESLVYFVFGELDYFFSFCYPCHKYHKFLALIYIRLDGPKKQKEIYMSPSQFCLQVEVN